MNTSYREVSCPQCGAPALFHPDNTYRPFCSARCRLIDLGLWADEQYRIPADLQPSDPEDNQ
ncbi:DNA gyrase inhibitor YacG [Formivibrio citricus]|uniref:DNA gyrase inhibitor YacG n=1 Tax=Formivibrio citricus TaxID=83765 RepID=UPI001C42FE4D|nr:DNA gyrase inhibitor YacG [Formivibrio citricus]